MKKTIKVFISSPGDVIAERKKAEQIIKRLNRQFGSHVSIEGVFWERQPLKATQDYQTNIIKPSSTDIVAVILWTRLGSDLSGEYCGAVTGKKPITGTEWEFEDAVAYAKTHHDTPYVSLYRKSSQKIEVNPTQIDEIQRQKRLIEAFDAYWAKNDDGSYAMASHAFERTEEFETMFESHLTELIEEILNQKLEQRVNWLEGSPFRGLESFEAKHRSIFFGREREINESREKLETQITKGQAFLLVTGASGSGKSSLVKAGLLPDLQIEGMVDSVAVTRTAIFSPSDDVAPINALVNSILEALPELRALQFDETNLLEHIGDCLPIKQALDRVAQEEQLTKIAQAKLILYIDQFEELFTTPNIDASMQQAFIDLLFKLFGSSYVWVIASMRSDFMSHLDRFPELIELLNGGAEYKLGFPLSTEIGQIINRPASEAGVTFERDKNDKGLDDFLRESASQSQSSLPLLEYLLDQLWEQRDQERGQLTFEAYKALGGLEGAIGRKAEGVYTALNPNEQKAMAQLIIMLASMVEQDNKITAKRVSKEQIEKNATIKACAKALMDVRLLISAKDGEGVEYYRVAHEAIFTHWQLAHETILVHKKDIQLRDQLEKESRRWQDETGSKEKKSLLLGDGLPLNEAVDLLGRSQVTLGDEVVTFIQTSEAKVKRSRMISRGLWSGFVIFLVVTVFILYGLMQQAKTERTRADNYRSQAEIIIDNTLFDLRDELTKLGRLDLLQSTQASVGDYYAKIGEAEHDPDTLHRIVAFNVNSGDIYLSLGNLSQAQEQYQKALAIRQKLVELDPSNAQWQSDLSVSYIKLGDFYNTTGDREQAEEQYKKALAIAQKLVELDPSNAQWQRDLSVSYERLGNLYNTTGDRKQAEEQYQKALAIRQKLVELDPTNAQWQSDLSVSYNNLGDLYNTTGDRKQAEEQYKKALAIAQKLVELDPSNAEWQMDLLKSHGKFGLFYRGEGQEAKALEEFMLCVPIFERILARFPDHYEWRVIANAVYGEMATSYENLNDEVNAEAYRNKAREIAPNP